MAIYMIYDDIREKHKSVIDDGMWLCLTEAKIVPLDGEAICVGFKHHKCRICQRTVVISIIFYNNKTYIIQKHYIHLNTMVPPNDSETGFFTNISLGLMVDLSNWWGLWNTGHDLGTSHHKNLWKGCWIYMGLLQ